MRSRTNKKYFLGIDPGKSGGWAIVENNSTTSSAWPWPKDSDIKSICKTLHPGGEYIVLACIEKVHAMPKQGVTSMFTFGENFGMWQGILAALGIPYVFAAPQKWQKAMFDSGGKEKNTKERSLDLARRLYPGLDLSRKKDNGKADALHLARYAKLQFNLEGK